MSDTKYLTFLTLACLAILAFNSTPAMACLCTATTPQQKYCEAEYAAVVTVTSVYSTQEAVYYGVQKGLIFKNGQKNLIGNTLATSPLGTSCAVTLELGKVYLIAGRGPQLTVCGYIKEYNKTTPDERLGFQTLYSRSCRNA